MSAPPHRAANWVRMSLLLFGSILIVGLVFSLLVFLTGSPGLGERRIRYQLTHQFAVDDPQFLRSMGQLLGPAILPGNRVTALQNGDQIFPSML